MATTPFQVRKESFILLMSHVQFSASPRSTLIRKSNALSIFEHGHIHRKRVSGCLPRTGSSCAPSRFATLTGRYNSRGDYAREMSEDEMLALITDRVEVRCRSATCCLSALASPCLTCGMCTLCCQ